MQNVEVFDNIVLTGETIERWKNISVRNKARLYILLFL